MAIAILLMLVGMLTPAPAVGPDPTSSDCERLPPSVEPSPPAILVYLAAYRANGPPAGSAYHTTVSINPGTRADQAGVTWVIVVVARGGGRSASVNWYAYAGGDPVNRTDPYGLCWEVITFENGSAHVRWNPALDCGPDPKAYTLEQLISAIDTANRMLEDGRGVNDFVVIRPTTQGKYNFFSTDPTTGRASIPSHGLSGPLNPYYFTDSESRRVIRRHLGGMTRSLAWFGHRSVVLSRVEIWRIRRGLRIERGRMGILEHLMSGTASAFVDTWKGGLRTARGLAVNGVDEAGEIAEQNRRVLAFAQTVTTSGLEGFDMLATKLFEKAWQSIPDDKKESLIDEMSPYLSDIVVKKGAYFAGRMIIGSRLVKEIMIQVLYRSASAIAEKRLAALKDQVRPTKFARGGLGVVVTGLMGQGTLERISESMERFQQRHPTIYWRLKAVEKYPGLEIGYFLLEDVFEDFLYDVRESEGQFLLDIIKSGAEKVIEGTGND